LEIKSYIERAFGYNLNTSWETLNQTYTWDSSCQGTAPQAISCFLQSINFEDAILKAVSIGGDSDTLACITGGIAEAYYANIPQPLIDRTQRMFPKEFFTILKEVRDKTAYGNLSPNPETLL